MGPPGPQGAPGPGTEFAPGSIVLSATSSGCAEGWAPAGQVQLTASPDYAASAEQAVSPLIVVTPGTTGWSNVSFFVCVKAP
jgi:hypothetical protein